MVICHKCHLEMDEGRKVIVLHKETRCLGRMLTCPLCETVIIITNEDSLVHENFTALPTVVV